MRNLPSEQLLLGWWAGVLLCLGTEGPGQESNLPFYKCSGSQVLVSPYPSVCSLGYGPGHVTPLPSHDMGPAALRRCWHGAAGSCGSSGGTCLTRASVFPAGGCYCLTLDPGLVARRRWALASSLAEPSAVLGGRSSQALRGPCAGNGSFPKPLSLCPMLGSWHNSFGISRPSLVVFHRI